MSNLNEHDSETPKIAANPSDPSDQSLVQNDPQSPKSSHEITKVKKPKKSYQIMKCVELVQCRKNVPQDTKPTPRAKIELDQSIDLAAQKQIQILENKRLKQQEADMHASYRIEKEKLRIELKKAKLEEQNRKHTDFLIKTRERLEKKRKDSEEKSLRELERRKSAENATPKLPKERGQPILKDFFTPVQKSVKSPPKSVHWLLQSPDCAMQVTTRTLSEDALQKFGKCLRGNGQGESLYNPPPLRLPPRRETKRLKLLQFHENTRPAYYGTWSRGSQSVGGRRPLGRDSGMDYAVDTDEEWQDDEPGENITDSEIVGDEEEGDWEDDGFLVSDGHLSEDEGNETVGHYGGMISNVLDRMLVGCVWGETSVMGKYGVIEIAPLEQKIVPLTNQSRKPVPEEAMEHIIRLLHGNARGMQSLITEFQLFWIKHSGIILDDLKIRLLSSNSSSISVMSPISRRQLELKTTAISSRERREDKKRWYVHADVLKEYGLQDLPSKNEWIYLIVPPTKSVEHC